MSFLTNVKRQPEDPLAPKFCINCAHFLKEDIIVGIGTVAHVCGKGKKAFDLVTGVELIRFSPCHIERSNVLDAECGPLGKKFQPKSSP